MDVSRWAREKEEGETGKGGVEDAGRGGGDEPPCCWKLRGGDYETERLVTSV